MDALETITLAEVSQKTKDRYHVLFLICGILSMQNEAMHETETVPRPQRTGQWWLGHRVGGGLWWEVGVSKCQVLHTEWINSKVLLGSTETVVCCCCC